MSCGLKNMFRKLTEFHAATHGCWSSQKMMRSGRVIFLNTNDVGCRGDRHDARRTSWRSPSIV